MNRIEPAYITDQSDEGRPLGGTFAAVGDWLHPVKLAPHLHLISQDVLRGFAEWLVAFDTEITYEEVIGVLDLLRTEKCGTCGGAGLVNDELDVEYLTCPICHGTGRGAS